MMRKTLVTLAVAVFLTFPMVSNAQFSNDGGFRTPEQNGFRSLPPQPMQPSPSTVYAPNGQIYTIHSNPGTNSSTVYAPNGQILTIHK
jgi:hypothetical protein